jgi:HEAT repeat protein
MEPESIVNAFLARYKELDDPDQVSQSLEDLRENRDVLVEPFIRLLEDEDALLRRPAALALGYVGDERAIKPLSGRLNEIDPQVRSFSAEALGRIGDARAVEPLMASLMDSHYRSSPKEITKSLVQIGEEAIKPLMNYIEGERNVLERQVAMQALGKLGHAPAVEILVKNLEDEESRAWSTKVLAEIGSTDVVDPLIGMLGDDDWLVREAAIRGLGNVGDQRAVEPLLAFLERGGDPLSSVIQVLVQIGDERVGPFLIKVLNNPDATVRKAAAEGLEKFPDPKAFKPLCVLLKDEDKEVRSEAINALRKIGDKRALKHFIAALKKDKDVWVRCRAIRGIVDFADSGAVKPLIEALQKDEVGFVRVEAAQALGELGDKRAIESLTHARSNDDVIGVREEAAKALKAFQ